MELIFFFKRIASGGGGTTPSYHPRTVLFLSALGGAGTLLSTPNAIILDRLVRDLHGEVNSGYSTENLFTSFRALYPIIGGTASAHSLNLIDPLLFPITWNGSPTHSANGLLTNGVNQNGNTGYNLYNEASLGAYSIFTYNKTFLASADPWIFGAFDGNLAGLRVNSSGIATAIGVNILKDGISEQCGKFTAIDVENPFTNGRLWTNGALKQTWHLGYSVKPNQAMMIGSVGTAAYGATDCQTFAFADRVFTPTEHAALKNAITAYNTALSRA